MKKQFNGFNEPKNNYSKLPHQLIDSLSVITSVGELKVILYVLRHTWGFDEYQDWQVKQITTDEFLKGRKKSDGTRLDKGIGISKPTLYKGLDLAVEDGFLVKYVDNTDLGRVTHYFRLRSPDDTESVLYATDPDRPGTSPWSNIDKEIKDRVYKRFQGRCAYCEGKSRKWHYDHIVPLAQDGPSDFENLALSCPPCNLTKGNRTPDQWGRQVILYDENDVKKVYRGWSNFFTGGGKESLHRTEKETKDNKLEKDIKSPTDFTALPVSKTDTVKKQPTPHQQMIVALATVMNIDPDVVNIWKRFGTFAKTLVPKYTAQQVEQWYGNGGWYWLYHWKGKKGEYPNQTDIQNSIKTASEHKEEKIDESILDLQQHFEQLTGFTRPLDLSQQTRQEWIQPCETLLEKANGNAKEVMTDALEIARNKGYTYKSPNSLLTIALNIIDGHSTNEGPASILEGV